MEKEIFVVVRRKLDKTIKEMSHLLAVSDKVIYSYEAGWRTIPAHVERQTYFLLSRNRGEKRGLPKLCWIVKNAPPKRREECPAYEYNAGRFC